VVLAASRYKCSDQTSTVGLIAGFCLVDRRLRHDYPMAVAIYQNVHHGHHILYCDLEYKGYYGHHILYCDLEYKG
jgi:hypothetical protein